MERARVSSHIAKDRQTVQQNCFLHVQQHRGAARDFVLPCKGRKREKIVSRVWQVLLLAIASLPWKKSGKTVGWDDKTSCTPQCLAAVFLGLVYATFECCNLENMKQDCSMQCSWCRLARVGQALAESSDAEEMGCVVIFLTQQDSSCMSAVSLILDAYSRDFPTGAV